MTRMLSASQLVGTSVNLDRLDRPVSPTRSLTPKAAAARCVTPPPGTQALSIEARQLTPTRNLDPRILTARAPVSPAQVSARTAGLVRMASGTQFPYGPVRSLERSLSPTRAMTPPPLTARTLTPTSAAMQARATPTTMLRATMPAAVCTPVSNHRSSTPVRSVAHRYPGAHYAGPAMAQAPPMWDAAGSKDASTISNYSNTARFDHMQHNAAVFTAEPGGKGVIM